MMNSMGDAQEIITDNFIIYIVYSTPKGSVNLQVVLELAMRVWQSRKVGCNTLQQVNFMEIGLHS
jgi:hypothetical protein